MKAKARQAKSVAKTAQAKRPRAKGPARRAPGEELPVVHRHAAGIDCGAEEHYVAVPPEALEPGESAVRRFSAFTYGLESLVEWLKQCGVATVAIESTGVYWIALYQKLETAGLEVVLVNARHVKNVPGRKTDVKDCQWLQQLHSFGLLSGSFRPEDLVCQLRSLQRHRDDMIATAASEIQHMQKALQQMNLHLHHAVSDINGVSGLRILDAILAGERDPKELAKLRDHRVKKSTVAEMEAALVGDYRAEHLFVLRQSLEAYRFYQGQIETCDRQIEGVLQELAQRSQPLPEPPPPPATAATEPASSAPPPTLRRKKARRPQRNEPKIDFRDYLRRMCGVDLCEVAGLNILTVLTLISEIGTDMSKWRNEKAFCSWLGLCPGNKISGGKVLSSRTRRVVNRAATALRLAAQSLGRTETCLGIFYRRKKAHLDAAKATTATARKLACIVYQMLKHRQEYRAPDPVAYQLKLDRRRLTNLRKQAASLGYQLVQQQPIAA